MKTVLEVCLGENEMDEDAQLSLCPLFILHKAAVASGVGGEGQD